MSRSVFPVLRIDRDTPGHAEMNHEGLAVIEFGEKIFGASPKMFDFAAGETFGKSGRKGNPEIPAARHDFGQPAMFKCGRKAHSHRFDLGKFGHGTSAIGCRRDDISIVGPYTEL